MAESLRRQPLRRLGQRGRAGARDGQGPVPGEEPAGLVLDGVRLAAWAVGAANAVIAVDEDATAEHDTLAAAIAEAASLGLLNGLEVRVHKVPAKYVAGEETSIISLLNGGAAIPRIRPPYPVMRG